MKKIISIPILLFVVLFANAQSVYNFSAPNIPYQNLVGSTSLNNGSVWDDPGYTIPIGFSFTIGTYTFSTIYVVDWSIGGILANSPTDGDIVPLFVPIGQDIIDLGFGSGVSQSNISYITEGSAGNRILKIEWNNVGFFEDSTASDFMNFQLWLYEGSNTIDYRYGPSSINNPTESFEGETGPLIALLTSYNIATEELEDNGYFLSQNPVSPSIITLIPGDIIVTTALNGMMPTGTVYRFEPQPLGVQNFQIADFVIYPNPVAAKLNIELTGDYSEVAIFNSLGQQLKQFENVANPLDVSELGSGIYLVQIKNSEGSAVKKFIKL